MKIAYFVERFPLISETFVLGQICGMIDRGHDVVIFADYGAQSDVHHAAIDEYELLDKVTVLPATLPTFFQRLPAAIGALASAAAAGQLRVVLRALNGVRFGRDAMNLKVLFRVAPHIGGSAFDIIHCQFGHLGIWVQRLRECGVLRGTLVTSFRGTDAMKIATQNPEDFAGLFEEGEKFPAVSRSVKRRLVEVGCPEDRVTILRSGIDLGVFDLRDDGSLHHPVRLLTIARLTPVKGIEFALEAVKLLLASGVEVEYRLLGDGPLAEKLQDLAKKLQLEDHVIFEGRVDSRQVIDAINRADILLAPSIKGEQGEQEGLPNSLKEAMAIGVPSIGTNTGGIPELIEDGVNGFLVNQKDAVAIAERIRSLVENWDASKDIVANGRKTVEEHFDLHTLNSELEEIYRVTAQCEN